MLKFRGVPKHKDLKLKKYLNSIKFMAKQNFKHHFFILKLFTYSFCYNFLGYSQNLNKQKKLIVKKMFV